MPKQLLIETRMNSLSLKEGVEKSQKKGCLGTLEGPCADFLHPTRNGNFYSRKLWENAFNDDIIKESLEDKVLLGELDHPGDRLETKAANAAIVMTGYSFDDENGLVNGTFDILDTPLGRVLKSLVDYGCKIGVSSRGEGDVEEINRDGEIVNQVDEDNYEFVAFDAVALPAVKAAKPTAINESLQKQKRKTLTESLLNEIKSATTISELDLIKKVVVAADLPDSDSILESVNHKTEELSGSTGSSSVMKDLEESLEEVQRLSEELSAIKSDLTTCQSKYSKQIKSRQKIVAESLRVSQELKDLRGKYSSLVFESGSSHHEIEDLKNQLAESRKQSKTLQSQLRSTSSKVKDYESEIKKLKESLSSSQESQRKLKATVSSLTTKLESVQKETNKKLEESSARGKRLHSNMKIAQDTLNEYRKSYIEETCQRQGIDSSKILSKVEESTTKSKIDSLIKEEVNRAERYKSLPLTQDKLIGLLEGATVNISGPVSEVDEESSRTYKFMEETSKLF